MNDPAKLPPRGQYGLAVKGAFSGVHPRMRPQHRIDVGRGGHGFNQHGDAEHRTAVRGFGQRGHRGPLGGLLDIADQPARAMGLGRGSVKWLIRHSVRDKGDLPPPGERRAVRARTHREDDRRTGPRHRAQRDRPGLHARDSNHTQADGQAVPVSLSRDRAAAFPPPAAGARPG